MTSQQIFRQFVARFEPLLRKISTALRRGLDVASRRAEAPLDVLVDILIGPTKFWPPMAKEDRWALQVAKDTLVRFGDMPEIDPTVVLEADIDQEMEAMRVLLRIAAWVRGSLSKAYDGAYWRALLEFEDPTEADRKLSEIFLGKQRIAHPLLPLARDIWFEFVP